MIVSQGIVFWAINSVSHRNARETISANLIATAHTFKKTLSTRGRELLDRVRLLTSDYAFKQAFATGEHGTILSAMENHQTRVGSDILVLLSLDGRVLADTRHSERFGQMFENTGLIDTVMDSETGEVESIEIFNETVYQVVVVPLFTPAPSALVVIGFIMGDDFAADLSKTTTETDISLLHKLPGGRWYLFATTLPNHLASPLPELISASDVLDGRTDTLSLSGRSYISLAVPFETEGIKAVALLQSSLEEQLAAYRRLRRTVLIVFLLALVGSIAVAVVISKSVVRPVTVLELGTRRVAAGEFGHRVEVKQRDELGQLAATFNAMSRGLEDRDRVRSLLGKVVSPDIAKILLATDIELGGEEKEVTVLFSDIRSFTTLCENLTPGQIVTMLNTYLTRVNTVIERHKGVVDKYIGDAVMALFGAPLNDPNSMPNAVEAGMDMLAAVNELNVEFSSQGTPELKIGIGIHTDIVLAGNIGSKSRLNYTVIGDGVNLASRLEGLSKYYGVDIIVSEATHKQAKGFIFRELDRVRVKGRTLPVTIYQPVGRKDALSAEMESEIAGFHDALAAYRSREWLQPRSAFLDLIDRWPLKKLYRLYLARVDALIEAPPGSSWDGVFEHKEK